MRLEDLIADLKRHKQDAYIMIDRCPVALVPKDVDSYRGIYEDLAISVEAERHSDMKVGGFMKLLESRIGTEMTGYKGGEYTIGPRTKVWISNYGECSSARVTGTRWADWGCVYITWMNDDD